MQNISIFNPYTPPQAEIYTWYGLNGSSIGLALAHAIRNEKRPILILAPDSLFASHLIDALSLFLGEVDKTLLFPDWETLPYDHFSPHQDIISERLAALYRLPQLKSNAVITTIATLIQRLPPREFLEGQSFLLKVGDELNQDILKTRLIKAGYHAVSQVNVHGEFAIRGSLIDIYAMGSKLPFRIDLIDNEIDSIRLFSPDTQRTLEKIQGINLMPAKEFPLTPQAIDLFRQNWRSHFKGNPLNVPLYQDISEGIYTAGIEYYLPFFFARTDTLFDYLPENILIITIGNPEIKACEFWLEINSRFEQMNSDIMRPILSPPELFISTPTMLEKLKSFSRISIQEKTLDSSQVQTNFKSKHCFNFSTLSPPALDINHKAHHPLALMQSFINEYAGRILFCAESMGRREVLMQLFQSIKLKPAYFDTWDSFLKSSEKYGMIVSDIDEGFALTEPPLTILTEAHLSGERVMQRRLRKKSAQDPDKLIRDLTELKINDPVVHIDHGVGRYLGLQTLTVGEQVGEFLTLEYQAGDKLYVPVGLLHLISRYSGTDLEHAPLNKLGTGEWQRTKRKAAEKIKDVAAELLDLYARRAARPGHQYMINNEQYAAFAAAFPFEETPDQMQAIEAVLTDMRSTKPMDRVICGDVGFGKTEVAMRAAFVAVQNNKQVVILVPTTLLAQQHFQNFQDRFAESAIQIEMISRFRTHKEQHNILERLAQGKIDIIIGTHKLIQNNITYKSLGLVIIDEEHRFGVKQKENLKSLRSLVDILTLTATPIPRTLNMAFSGLRDLSIIATPPARRLSVKTFVHEYQDSIAQEAIQREIFRGGQVYFLHNEVSSIAKKVQAIGKLVPEARIVAAHGQMHERELERVMADFYHRRFNVLVSSTIIESGIDIPTANTILIDRADKFGMAQLHQLRGRVGRSHHQAYAYLFVPSRENLTANAKKRLDAFSSLDDLGIGFTLATHDLEIRGAGELLGEDQSGNMQQIGFTLYMDLLSRAVDTLKMGASLDADKLFLTTENLEIDLHIPALIPESYLHDVQLRLQFYKRIANAKNQLELDEIQVEMIDRFGLLPNYLKNLIALRELKYKADQLGIIKIEANEKGGKIEFNNKPTIQPEIIIKLIQKESSQFRLEGPTRLRFKLPTHEANERIACIEKILQRFYTG